MSGSPAPSRQGTLAVSWGKSGGWYIARGRICFGRVAFTYVPHVELDQMMRAYAEQHDPLVDWREVAVHRGGQVERMRYTLDEITQRDWWENALDPQWAAKLARARLAHELSIDRGETLS